MFACSDVKAFSHRNGFYRSHQIIEGLVRLRSQPSGSLSLSEYQVRGYGTYSINGLASVVPYGSPLAPETLAPETEWPKDSHDCNRLVSAQRVPRLAYHAKPHRGQARTTITNSSYEQQRFCSTLSDV